MLPRLDVFLAGVHLFGRRRSARPIALDEAAIARALEHAAQLAAGDERDEPAALFFACALRSRAFGAMSRTLLPILARNQTVAIGARLDVDDIELTILHLRIARSAITFEEVRDTFAAALADPGGPPARPPPDRPG